MPTYDEEDIQALIAAYKRREYVSISRTSRAFRIPRTTLQNRIRKPNLSNPGHITQQILSPIEVEVLIN